MSSGGLISRLSQTVASGVGLAAEAHQYNKAKKVAKREREEQERRRSQEVSTTVTDSSLPVNENETTAQDEQEREWELDEAQDELVEGQEEGPRKSRQGTANPDKVVAAFLNRHPLSSLSDTEVSTATINKLQYPVLIPQRRPKDKQRGFIRAYAPDLQNLGIDQATWLDFIETFNEASLANPWLNAINLASLATNALPSVTAIAVSIAIQIATDIAIETQGRYRQNKSLDKLNREFFRPRGLYCLVMTWDATSVSNRTNIDINTTIQNSMNSQGNLSHKFQSSSGTTSEFEFMQTADLVFPGLDYLAAVPKEESKGLKQKIKSGKRFLDDYMDRRAQAKFAGSDPDNLLSKGINPTFASKYADPRHPINSGSIYSLISLGHFNPPPLRDVRNSGGLGGRLDAIRGGGFSLESRGDIIRGRMQGQGTLQAFQGGHRPEGPIESIISLVGMAAQAVQNRGNSVQQNQGGFQPSQQHSYQQQYFDSRQAIPNERGYNPPAPYAGYGTYGGRGHTAQDDGPLGIRRLLRKRVLYLMIVNIPTEEEVEQARTLAAEWNLQGLQESTYEFSN